MTAESGAFAPIQDECGDIDAFDQVSVAPPAYTLNWSAFRKPIKVIPWDEASSMAKLDGGPIDAMPRISATLN